MTHSTTKLPNPCVLEKNDGEEFRIEVIVPIRRNYTLELGSGCPTQMESDGYEDFRITDLFVPVYFTLTVRHSRGGSEAFQYHLA